MCWPLCLVFISIISRNPQSNDMRAGCSCYPLFAYGEAAIQRVTCPRWLAELGLKPGSLWLDFKAYVLIPLLDFCKNEGKGGQGSSRSSPFSLKCGLVVCIWIPSPPRDHPGSPFGIRDLHLESVHPSIAYVLCQGTRIISVPVFAFTAPYVLWIKC